MKSFIEQARLHAHPYESDIVRYTHMAGVLFIIYSLMILLGFVKIIIPGVGGTDLACLATLALVIYYFTLNWQLALPLAPILFFLVWIASLFTYDGPSILSLWIFIISYVIGIGLYLYGHFAAGRKVAFTYDLCHIVCVPLFITADILFRAGYLAELKKEMYGTNGTKKKAS